jgi:endonuclease/exonuclease/phosphatase family metal-dependent hydrolase
MERATPGIACPEEAWVDVGPGDTTALRWYRAAEERDVGLASRWCATVGQPVLELEPTGPFPSWTASSGLEVATWNMQIDGGDLYGFLAGELGLDCSGPVPSLGARRRPFVVLLQEVWRHDPTLPPVRPSRIVPWTIDEDDVAEWNLDAPRPAGSEDHDIVDTAKACGLAVVYVPSARNGPDSDTRPREDKGNAILSSLPLSTPIAFDLPLEGGRKVAVAATLRAPGAERVRVVSVHLDVASTLVRTLGSGNQTRTRQAEGLLDGLRRAERDGPLTQVVVVGGDFNTWVGSETTLRRMRRAFPHSPEWDGAGTRGSFPADHIFFRRRSFEAFEATEYRRVPERYGSDHHGRRVVLRYRPMGER